MNNYNHIPEQEHYPESMGTRIAHGNGSKLRPAVTAKLRSRPPLDYLEKPSAASQPCGALCAAQTVVTICVVIFAPICLLIGAVAALS